MGLFSNTSQKFKSLNLCLLLITLPKNLDENTDFLQEIGLTEQLLNSLAALNEPFVFEVSVHNIGTEIHFYLAVHRDRIDYAKQQILAIFPDAGIDEIEDYTIFDEKSEVVGAYLSLKDSYMLPVKSYVESNFDTFAPILGNFGQIEKAGEGLSLQIMMRPAEKRSESKITNAIERLRKGEKFKEIKKEGIANELIKFAIAEQDRKDENEPVVIDEEAIKQLEKKLSKPLFDVNVRLVASGPTDSEAERMFRELSGSFSQVASPTSNAFVINKARKIKDLVYLFTFREFSEKQKITLNAEELASIFHLPTTTTNTPTIKWMHTKKSPPPTNLMPQDTEGLILGDSVYQGGSTPVILGEDDRRRHMYIVGQTGTGKSALIKFLASQDVASGKGLCIMDPNGDLVDDILNVIPKERIDDVIVFDPSNIKRPLGLNMLEFDPSKPEEKTFIVNEMQSILNRLFSEDSMGPMFEQYMRNALLLLMEDSVNEPATLTEIPRVFTDAAWRKKKVARITNPLVADFWTNEAEKAGGDAALANMTPYITSKFNNFIANDYMRPIIGQYKSAFNFREVMDSGKILLVKLPKGRIGDINANLLGMIITGKLLMAALARDDQAQEDRKDFYFYIDEFQNFTTDSIATILAEARKYRLNLTVAHQYIAQLPDNIRDAVFGNVGTMLAFRVGIDDAEQLVKQFEPKFEINDMINIENLNGVIRMLVNGQPIEPFNMKIRFAERGTPAIREKLLELSGLTYGANLNDIERQIMRRIRG